MEIEFQEKLMIEKKDKNSIISKLDKAMSDLHEYKRNNEIQRSFENEDLNEPHKTQNSESLTRSIYKKETGFEKDAINVRTVTYEEISLIAKELMFNLMINRIDLENAPKVSTLIKISICLVKDKLKLEMQQSTI